MFWCAHCIFYLCTSRTSQRSSMSDRIERKIHHNKGTFSCLQNFKLHTCLGSDRDWLTCIKYLNMISTHPQDLQIFPVKRLPFNRITRKMRCTGKKRKGPSVFTQVCQIWKRKCPLSLKRKCLSHLQVKKRKCPSLG
jgi:hypothetical protein